MIAILLGNVLFAPLSALLAIAWAWRSDTPFVEIGLVRPRRWVPAVLIGVGFGVALKLFSKAILLPLLHADPINHAFHQLVGNRAAIPGMLYALVIGAGIRRGSAVSRLFLRAAGAPVRPRCAGRLAALLLTSALFAAAHLHDQGVAGAEQALFTGLALGALYLATGSLAMPMIAHASFDLLAYWIIYWDLEARVAHLVFH